MAAAGQAHLLAAAAAITAVTALGALFTIAWRFGLRDPLTKLWTQRTDVPWLGALGIVCLLFSLAINIRLGLS